MILSRIAPLLCPNSTRPTFLPPRIDSVMFSESERCAPGSAKLAGIGLGQPGPMFFLYSASSSSRAVQPNSSNAARVSSSGKKTSLSLVPPFPGRFSSPLAST